MAAAAPLFITAGVLGLAGGIAEGQSARAQSEFVAAVNEQQARRERQVSAGEERDFRRGTSATFAERRAAMGASGVSPSTGTPLAASSDFAAEAELQALRIRSGGETRATRLEQQARLTRAGGRAAERRGFFRGGASLLSGLGQAFG